MSAVLEHDDRGYAEILRAPNFGREKCAFGSDVRETGVGAPSFRLGGHEVVTSTARTAVHVSTSAWRLFPNPSRGRSADRSIGWRRRLDGASRSSTSRFREGSSPS